MHYLSAVYFVIQPPHDSGILWPIIGRYTVYIQQTVPSQPAKSQSTKMHNTYQLLYMYSIPPDDGLQICLEHVEVDGRINRG